MGLRLDATASFDDAADRSEVAGYGAFNSKFRLAALSHGIGVAEKRSGLMAELPKPEERARKILEIYLHFQGRPGHVLRMGNFYAIAAKWRLASEDINSGLEKALELGWIESTDGNSFRLTAAGFGQVANLPTSEENARKILEIFVHFQGRPGHVLRMGNFYAIAAKWRLASEDVNSGLEKALELGWVETADGKAFRLTTVGFEQM